MSRDPLHGTFHINQFDWRLLGLSIEARCRSRSSNDELRLQFSTTCTVKWAYVWSGFCSGNPNKKANRMHASLHSCDYCKHQSRKKKKRSGHFGSLEWCARLMAEEASDQALKREEEWGDWDRRVCGVWSGEVRQSRRYSVGVPSPLVERKPFL